MKAYYNLTDNKYLFFLLKHNESRIEVAKEREYYNKFNQFFLNKYKTGYTKSFEIAKIINKNYRVNKNNYRDIWHNGFLEKPESFRGYLSLKNFKDNKVIFFKKYIVGRKNTSYWFYNVWKLYNIKKFNHQQSAYNLYALGGKKLINISNYTLTFNKKSKFFRDKVYILKLFKFKRFKKFNFSKCIFNFVKYVYFIIFLNLWNKYSKHS